MTPSEKLKRMRLDRKLRCDQAALRIGISDVTLAAYENGKIPKWKRMKKLLADFYGADYEVLWGEKYPKKLCRWCSGEIPEGVSGFFCCEGCREMAAVKGSYIEPAIAPSDRKEVYNPASGETYAEYQRRRNPDYYKSIYIASNRKGET